MQGYALSKVRLCFVTDPDLLSTGKWQAWVKRLILGGVDMVQLRHKKASTRELIALAKALKKCLKEGERRVPLIINDRVDVALVTGADGVHLGNEDMPYRAARDLLGEQAIIGLSVETMDDVKKANAWDVSYLGISAVFGTETKTNLKTLWGLAGVRRLRSCTRHVLMGIGGIGTENARDVMAAGADAIAVVSALCCVEDPYIAAMRLKALL